MAATQTMRLYGDKKLIAALNALPRKVYDKTVKKSMRKAINPMKTAMRKNARKHRGKTRKSGPHLAQVIKSRVRTYRANSNILVTAGPKWPEGAHGHLLEWGHRIVTGGTHIGTELARKGGTKSKRRGMGRSTGARTRAFLWMTPAYESIKGRCLQILKSELAKNVQIAATQLGRANA